MADVLRLLKAVDVGLNLFQEHKRAQKEGRAVPLGDLFHQGLDVLDATGALPRSFADALISRGSGIYQSATGQPEDGEIVRIGDRTPRPEWERGGLTSFLERATYGAHAIFGPIGSGKTTLALWLARNWAIRNGYIVETVSAYPDDLPPWVQPISLRTMVARAELLAAYLDQQTVEDPLQTDVPKRRRKSVLAPTITKAMIESFSRRVVIFEELGLSLGGFSGISRQRAKAAAVTLMMQCRHLDSLVIYVGQLQKQLPDELRTNTTCYFKRPSGEEVYSDDLRDTRGRHLWMMASAGFGVLHSHPYYPAYPDDRDWAFGVCPDVGGGVPYQGLFPYRSLEIPHVQADDGAAA